MADARRILMTGGTGFIGRRLSERVLAEGAEVHVVVQPGFEDVCPGATGHLHDGTTAGLLGIVESVQPELVYHLASLYLAAHTPDDIERLIASNVLLGTQLLEGMAQAGCTRLINTGTGWQRFGTEAYDPVNLYAATKQAFEDIAAYYVARGISTTTLTLFDTFGPADPRPKVLPLLIKAALSGERLDLSPGDQQLYLVYIDDIIDAFVHAGHLIAEQDAPGVHRYSVVPDEALSLKQIAAVVEQVTGRTIDAHWGGRPYRDREVLVPWVGARLPGWSPKVSLAEGIRLVIQRDAETV